MSSKERKTADREAKGKTPDADTPRSFDPQAALPILTEAVEVIALAVGTKIKKTLGERVTDAEARAMGAYAARTSLIGLLLNPKVMLHVADARTSNDKGKLKKGKTKALVESQLRAVQLKNENMLVKQIPDQLVKEKLAVICPDGAIKLTGMKKAIPSSSWDGSMTRWANKCNGSA